MANIVQKPAQILGYAASAVTTAATSTVSAGLQTTVDVGLKLLNPFNVDDDIISHNIISIHDSQAVRLDVDSLYNVVSNIVRSSNNITNSLDLKQVKSVDLVEDKVPQSGFKPSYNMLKEIACQMTCHPFNAINIHGSVVGVLEKLKSYTWDAKAVIALSAFALDFGETWRLSLMQATNKKENALELHIFKLDEDEDAKKTKEKANNADLISTLVDRTLQLIDGIIKLERLIANKAYSSKDVPALFKAPRDLYTYWAILGLMACANQMFDLEWNIKSEIVGRIKLVLTQLNADLEEIKLQIDLLDDFTWRLNVFQTPSGILELLKALIFPKDFKQLDIIFDATTKNLVKLDELKTKNLLLFISGLDNIEDEIWALKPIHDSITKEKDKKDYKIVWVPVVENWTNEAKVKFEHLKSLMPWYVVQYFSLVKGYKPLQEEWNYTGKPIVVVTNPRGEVLNKNALHLIFVWGISAFPFRLEDEERVSQHWNWLWNEVFQINADIQKWVNQENKYVFLYGGTDFTLTQRYGNLLETIRNDPLIKQTDTYIEHFNLAKVDITTQTKFWLSITNSFLSKIQKLDFNLDSTLKDIQTLLSMKTEKGWVLLSKGDNVLLVGYNELIAGVLEGFESWKKNVVEFQGFDIAFKDCYDRASASIPLHCLHFELNNIRSAVPTNISCPNQSCGRKMEIESVNYKCCHGMHSDQATQNDEIVNAAVTKTKLFGTP